MGHALISKVCVLCSNNQYNAFHNYISNLFFKGFLESFVVKRQKTDNRNDRCKSEITTYVNEGRFIQVLEKKMTRKLKNLFRRS